MKKKYLIGIAVLFCTGLYAQKYEHHEAKTVQVADTFFHSRIVPDPYRWLENTNSDESHAWLDEQDEFSKKYLSKYLNKNNTFSAIDNYSHTDFDFVNKKGKYFFVLGYNDQFGVPVLYYKPDLNGTNMLLIDPNTISAKDRIVLKSYEVSGDSKFLAYQYTRNGSDWTEMGVMSLDNGKQLDDHLEGLKFSPIAWRSNGFFYSTYEQLDQFGQTNGQKVLYHEIGTNQAADKLIFERKNNPSIQFYFQTTFDEHFFILNAINKKTNKVNIYYIDYLSEQPLLKPLLTNLSYNVNVVGSHDGKLIAITYHKSDKGMIVEIDPANPLKWRSISEGFTDASLSRVIIYPDCLVNVYKQKQHPLLMVMDYDGKVRYKLELPVASSLSGFSENPSDEKLYFYFTSYTIPPVVYEFNTRTFERKLTRRTEITFTTDDIVYEEMEYISGDSIRVPLVLVHQKDLQLDGKNPTLLTAYGGFGIDEAPSFNPAIVHFVKKGGIFAFAHIRGGGGLGAKWTNDGRGKNKQNSFNDFIAAAEYLIKNKYTNKDKLAITGGSNGGLVVAAAATQRPELFKAVVPVVAPLDMLRFELFTIGSFHKDEYGTVNDSASFENLRRYSPYHQIKEDINYPAMLVVTSENDDRVPPFHSYKFVARLQNRAVQTNPILLKTEKKSGHYGASTSSSRNQEKADIFGFIMSEIMND